MKRVAIREHERLFRRSSSSVVPEDAEHLHLDPRLYDRLKRFDQLRPNEGDRVFEWGDGTAKAQQWVGVVQLAGLQVEILPKVDDHDAGKADNDSVRKNLIYMLAIAGDVPLLMRDLARLANRKAALSEVLAGIFADRLLGELLRGPERSYVRREENLRRFKGRLLVSPHTLHNAAHRERFYCRYDEFCEDTLMNRLFRAGCRFLLDVTTTPPTQDKLRHCLLVLDGVADIAPSDEHFDQVAITRQNERFADVFRFCRLILAGRSPTVQAAGTQTFSLLYDMNRVFERFIANFLQTRVMPKLPNMRLFIQARQRHRHLMVSDDRGALALKPDLLIEADDGSRLVIDTKWKRLGGGKGRGGVSEADLYQMFAYTRRFGASRSVLLYPWADGVSDRDFEVLDGTGEKSGERVGVRFAQIADAPVGQTRWARLEAELRAMVSSEFGTC